MHWMLRTLAVTAAAAVALLAGAPAAMAMDAAASPAHAPAVVSTDVNDFEFTSLHVDYTLGRADDGTSTLDVVETFVAVFPDVDQNRGMRRSIPDSYLGMPLRAEFESITDGDGQPRPHEVDRDDGYFTMTSRADDYVHGAQTYVFRYRLHNVTRFFENTDADEFYWNVNGTEWLQPFGEVSMTLRFADGVGDARTGAMACYRGSAGSSEVCEIAAVGDEVQASASGIRPYQTMTIAVAFEKGTFTPFDSSYLASGWGWAQGVAGIGLVGTVIAAIAVRRRKLQDEPGRPTIIAEYTPPREIDALESAVLLGKPTQAIPAEVLEQAVVGSIRIVEGSPKMFGGVKLKAVLVDPARADGDGRMLLDGLFPDGRPGDEYEFGSTDTRMSTTAHKILKAAEAELKRRGMRRPVPGWTRAWPILLTAGFTALVLGFGFAALSASVNGAIPVVLVVLAGIAFFVVMVLMMHRPFTAKGAETRDHLLGLKEFIEWAEADRIRMLQSPQGAERVPFDVDDPRVMLKLYESLLPYAVVFGQEKEWAKQLAVLYDTTGSPGWYAGASGFNAVAFSSGISSLSSASSASSSSGGSSGGGSAGGGGGGGGGGGV